MALTYKSGQLYMENTNVMDIADEVGSPVYCYSMNSIRKNYREFANNLPGVLVCYAVKANPNVAIIKIIADMGGGADVVSEGEMRRALEAGVPAHKIVFSGVGKTSNEIRYALSQGVYQLNVESMEELVVINQIALDMKVIAPVALRINPNIDAETHEKITTGLKINKFGISEETVYKIYNMKFSNVEILGISIHIGSQITKLEIFENAIIKIKEICSKLEDYGHKISRIDLGGGLGISYGDSDQVPSIASYTKLIRDNISDLGYKIICEPGRAIVGDTGIMLTKVLYTKKTSLLKHVIVDAGLNDLIRPSLYNSKHRIIPVKRDERIPKEVVDVVGPICESGDVFAHRYSMQRVSARNILAICEAGAYGASMSSTYNSRMLTPEVLVSVDQYVIIRKRLSYEEYLKQDIVTDWIYKY